MKTSARLNGTNKYTAGVILLRNFDKETGTIYLRARYYNPAVGRFITEDSVWSTQIECPNGQKIDDPLSLNLYTYCYNNPVNAWDPSGNEVAWYQAGSLVTGFISGGFSELSNNVGGIFKIWDNINAMKDLINGIASGEIGWEQLKQMGFDTVAGDLKYVYDNRNIIFDDESYSSADIKAYGKHLAGAYAELVNIGATVYGVAMGAKGLVNKIKGAPKPVVGGCFTAGTLVPTEDGQRPIEEVKVGDYVWSENSETGEKGLKKVVNTFIHDKYTLIHVYTGDTMIETTEEHPFWVEDKGWVFAGELNEGYVLRLKSGENVKVTKLERVDLKEPVKVYNFEVQDWHTYYVSDINVLVHNNSMKEPTNIKMLDDKFIKKKGFDPHTVKSDALGTNKDLDKFDIYLDKDTGQMWVYRKGGKGMGQPTGEYIK